MPNIFIFNFNLYFLITQGLTNLCFYSFYYVTFSFFRGGPFETPVHFILLQDQS